PSNKEFLEHELWLISMISELEALEVHGSAPLESRVSQLMRAIRHELARLQTHKEVEWGRQGQTIAACEATGSHFFDTGEYPLRQLEMKDWLGRLLSRIGLEDIMDKAAERARGLPKPVMSDLWDAPVFREVLLDGRPFVHGPPDEGRYVFALSIDSFNPFQSKEAKQNVSVTGIYMVCLNLPPHLRYLPENVYLVGIIP
ncbi:hypothetical protein C8Q77DRAFT_1040507, partial [Trametes polyzona]